jgi:hypothetical protein
VKQRGRLLVVAAAVVSIAFAAGLGAYCALGSGSSSRPAAVSFPPAPGFANVALSPSGADATCQRAAAPAPIDSLQPCGTFQGAYRLAQSGDIVAVRGGAYGADDEAAGATQLAPTTKTAPGRVTFQCAGSDPVSFSAPSDQFVITAQHVTIQGSCFQFNRLWIGNGSNGISTSDVTIDGVSMMMFDISGSSNVTIENSQVGPDVACYGPGSGSASCQDIASDHEAYFAENGRPNTNFNEPKIHDGGPSGNTPPSNVTISNDTFLEIQSRDPVNLHTGCLWVGYGASGGPVTVTGSTFNGCMTYDIHVDSPTTPSLAVTNNRFGTPMDALRGGTDFASVAQMGSGQVDYEVKCQSNEVISNYTITGNTFSRGYDLDFGGCSNPSYRGVSISGNVGGTQSPAGS